MDSWNKGAMHGGLSQVLLWGDVPEEEGDRDGDRDRHTHRERCECR